MLRNERLWERTVENASRLLHLLVWDKQAALRSCSFSSAGLLVSVGSVLSLHTWTGHAWDSAWRVLGGGRVEPRQRAMSTCCPLSCSLCMEILPVNNRKVCQKYAENISSRLITPEKKGMLEQQLTCLPRKAQVFSAFIVKHLSRHTEDTGRKAQMGSTKTLLTK